MNTFTTTTTSALGTSALAVTGPTSAYAAEAAQPHRKTMSDKVLAAIALERVTGMKPDPARLTE